MKETRTPHRWTIIQRKQEENIFSKQWDRSRQRIGCRIWIYVYYIKINNQKCAKMLFFVLFCQALTLHFMCSFSLSLHFVAEKQLFFAASAVACCLKKCHSFGQFSHDIQICEFFSQCFAVLIIRFWCIH